MKDMPITIESGWIPAVKHTKLLNGGESFFAYHPYLPGVNASGETRDEAAENWIEALNIYLAHCDAHQLARPRQNYFIARINFSSDLTSAASTLSLGIKISMGQLEQARI